MSRDIASLLSEALDNEMLEVFFAVDLEFDSGTLRLWTGYGEKMIDGEVYTGTGALMQISDVEETAELAAAGAVLTLDGIPTEILTLALSEPYQNRRARIYFGLSSSDLNVYALPDGVTFYTPLGVADASAQAAWASGFGTRAGMAEVFTATMDAMDIDENVDTVSIRLTLENRLLDLERARIRRYTNNDQQARYPGDRGLEFVDDLQDREILWGRAS